MSLGGFLKELSVDFAAENIFKVDNTVYCLCTKRVKSISHEHLSPGVNELNFDYGNYSYLHLLSFKKSISCVSLFFAFDILNTGQMSGQCSTLD